jgi:hypothetical protein
MAALHLLAPETAAHARSAGMPPPACMPAEADEAASVVKDPVRYKTVMCQNWLTRGSCPYGHKCQFAHGEEEMRSKASKRRGRAGGEGKGRRGAAGTKTGAAVGPAAAGAPARTGSAVARQRRPEPPPSPQLRPSSSGERAPSPFALPWPLFPAHHWDGLARAAPLAGQMEPAPRLAAGQPPPCPSEMLELSKAALEQSILLSHGMGSFAVPTGYPPARPQPPRHAPQHETALPQMPCVMPHPSCRAPIAPLPPASLATLMGQERMAASYMYPREQAGHSRSSDDWSGASTAMASLDSTFGEHTAAAAADLASRPSQSLDDLHLDRRYDSHFDYHRSPLNFPTRPLPPPATFSAPGRSTPCPPPDHQSISTSLSFLWGDEQTDVAPGPRCLPNPFPVKPPMSAAPGPALPRATPVDFAAESLRSSYASALQEIDFSKGAAHVACQLDRLLSGGPRAPAAAAFYSTRP